MDDLIFHEPVHVQYLHPLKRDYIRKAKDMGRNKIMLSASEKKELYNLEIKFGRQKEFNANIISALENYDIAYSRKERECFLAKELYNKIINNKYDKDRIHPSDAYTCYILIQVLAAYKEAMDKENDTKPDPTNLQQ